MSLELHMEKGHPFYTMRVNYDKTANTETFIELLEHNFQHAKYQLSPKTGKQHQLRVHLNHLNIPILNDPFIQPYYIKQTMTLIIHFNC